MKLKLDENLPRDLAADLASYGHDVDTVLDEQLGGQEDPVVVRAGTGEGRMVITLDRGVGDLRHYPPGATPASSSSDPPAKTPSRSCSSSLGSCEHTSSTSCGVASSSWSYSGSVSDVQTKRSDHDPR